MSNPKSKRQKSKILAFSPRLGQKRGSHVGVVLSFVLFITFIVFMYVLLDVRVNQEKGKANPIEYVKAEILESVSSELTIIPVAVSTSGQNCVQLDNFFGIMGISNRFRVRSESGNTLIAGTSGQSLQVSRDDSFFIIHEAEEFSPETGSISCTSDSYTIGLVQKETLVFESKISDFLNNYTIDYNNFKKLLNISSSDEFGLIFTYNDGGIVRTPDKNTTSSIYASSVPVQYVRTNGARESGSLTALVW